MKDTFDAVMGIMKTLKDLEDVNTLVAATMKPLVDQKRSSDQYTVEERTLMVMFATFKLVMLQYQLTTYMNNLKDAAGKDDETSDDFSVTMPDIDVSKLKSDLN